MFSSPSEICHWNSSVWDYISCPESSEDLSEVSSQDSSDEYDDLIDNRETVLQERPIDFDRVMIQASTLSLQRQGMFKGIIRSPALTAPSPLSLNSSFGLTPLPSLLKRPKSPKRDHARHGSVPPLSPTQSVAIIAPPPAEIRKISNMMSLLNSEPEEPRASEEPFE